VIDPKWLPVKEADGDGHMWTVPKDQPSVKVECWWNRVEKPFRGKVLKSEHFIIRQENETTHADIIFLTQAQVYGLIQTLNEAVMET
jgi:hypothetical protein